MDVAMFLLLLSVFSVLTSLITEAVKKFLFETDKRFYNVVVLIVALIVGVVGTLLYYRLNHIPIVSDTYIYAFLMGLASSVTSMVGYDKVKEAIKQLGDI